MTHAVGSGANPADMLQALLDQSQQLRNDVRERERRQRRTNALMATGIFLVLVMVAALLTLLVQSRQRGNDTRALIRNNSATSEQIADCITAGGTCYEQGHKQTAAALQQLINAQVEIQSCAKKTSTDAELRACIAAALTPPTTRPSPTTKETP